MIFGFFVPVMWHAYLGIAAFVLIVFEILVGLRKIKFKGRLHSKVHRITAWTILGITTVHGFIGILYTFGLRIG